MGFPYRISRGPGSRGKRGGKGVKARIGTLNVSSLTGKGRDLADRRERMVYYCRWRRVRTILQWIGWKKETVRVIFSEKIVKSDLR